MTRWIRIVGKRGLALPLKAVPKMGADQMGPTTKEIAGNGSICDEWCTSMKSWEMGGVGQAYENTH